MKRLGWFVLSLFVLALASRQSARADEADDEVVLAKILGDWRKRQAAVHSVSCKISGNMFIVKGWGNRPPLTEAGKSLLVENGGRLIPAVDTTLPYHAGFLLEFDKNWARKELNRPVLHQELGEFVPQHETHLYSGDRIKWYQPREKNTSSGLYTPSKAQPDLWIQSDGLSNAFFAVEDTPLFWGCGIVKTTALLPQGMRKSSDLAAFSVHGRAEHQGRECVVLRATPSPTFPLYYEYWVDMKRDSAVLRCSVMIDDELQDRVDAQYERHGDLWFPKRWTFSNFWYSTGELQATLTLHVDELAINPTVDISDFDVKLKPGMVVRDVQEDTHGVIGDDGKTLLPLSEIDKIGKRSKRWRYLLAAGCVLLVLVATVILLRKRYRRNHPASPFAPT